MATLVCGALAYDTIMVLDEKFKQNIELNKSNMWDAYFYVPDLRRQFGGCAGNIAYNLKLLNAEPKLLATVGNDFTAYAEWLDEQGINRDYIKQVDHSYTAQTFIVYDAGENKITAFHPGAMHFSNTHNVPHDASITLGVIAADYVEGMLRHALQLSDASIPFLFSPSHTAKELVGDDMLKLIEQAQWMVVNLREWAFISQQVGLSAEQLSQRLDALVVNKGLKGAEIFAQNTRFRVPCPRVRAVNDFTASHDAFCAGLLYGIEKDIDWETTGRIATLMNAIAVEHHGAQQHRFDIATFKQRFKKQFGYALLL